MTFKKFLYNATIILPVISKITETLSLIKELVDSNKAVSMAQEKLSKDLDNLNKYISEVEKFNEVDDE